MNSLRVANAINHLDDDLIIEAMKYKPKKTLLIKWAAVAACMCLIIVAAVIAYPKLSAGTGGEASAYQVYLYQGDMNEDGATLVGTALFSAEKGLTLPHEENDKTVSALHIAHTSDSAETNMMSLDEAKEYAYMELEGASSELAEKILAARRIIIFSSDWVADGYGGYIQDVVTGEIIRELPTFSELFPGWDIPIVESAISTSRTTFSQQYRTCY